MLKLGNPLVRNLAVIHNVDRFLASCFLLLHHYNIVVVAARRINRVNSELALAHFPDNRPKRH